MPRYIDADALLEKAEYTDAFSLVVPVRCIDEAPAVDVAPRAEVAQEIVEFLFRRSKSLQHLFKNDPNSAQCFRGRFELENAAVIIANDYGLELKKKYTEEQT